MIFHLVTAQEWHSTPDLPYAPASLAAEGFVHCSPDEAVTLAVATAFYSTAPRPLLALVLDEGKLSARCVWEAPAPAPPPGTPEGTLFPHVFGPVDRDAVDHILVVDWDERGHATGLKAAG